MSATIQQTLATLPPSRARHSPRPYPAGLLIGVASHALTRFGWNDLAATALVGLVVRSPMPPKALSTPIAPRPRSSFGAGLFAPGTVLLPGPRKGGQPALAGLAIVPVSL